VAAEPALPGPATVAADYVGEPPAALAAKLGVAGVVLYRTVGSTMDAGHALGEAGAPAGTLVLADAQTAGRGRQGNAWRSPAGRGIWLTLLERPLDASGVPVLSLRVGLATARALDAFTDEAVRLKWPNDVYAGTRKVAGVLVEARWRGVRLDWVAIGIGVNVLPPPGMAAATGLRRNTSRLDVLGELVPAVRGAAALTGLLDGRELEEFRSRDYARGRRCIRPSAGVVAGVSAMGELAVETPAGTRYYRTGSLVLEEGV
jgi:BirA family biotin operon repressor/biotin-[acetyl-CoA-carboxylase] ligase